MPCSDELLRLAVKAGRLANQVSSEPEAYRIAGRLNRLIQFQPSDLSEREVTAFAESHVDLAKTAEDPFSDDPDAFCALHCAIALMSYGMWESLWDLKHPDRFGEACKGEDADLMSIWREKVRTIIKECHQDAVFVMTAEQYITQLIDAGASTEAAEELGSWLSVVKYEGDAPST
jgi:hypothetical protein